MSFANEPKEQLEVADVQHGERLDPATAERVKIKIGQVALNATIEISSLKPKPKIRSAL